MLKTYKMSLSRAWVVNVPSAYPTCVSFLATMPTPMYVRKGYAQMPPGEFYSVGTGLTAVNHSSVA